MLRLVKAARVAVIGVVVSALLAGCSESAPKAVPHLPERVCWGAFSGSEVAALLPEGKKVTVSNDAFEMTDSLDSETCSVDVDGATRFMANARLQEFERSIEWSSWDSRDPRPLDVGKGGVIWDGGGATHFACEPSTSPSDPGKYIALYVHTLGGVDREKIRSAVPGLLKEFMTFAQRELKCPGGSAGR
ncbi:hypothetical protein [Streptomyces hydrogenans]|uniref:hypothetical protein n=1 Tax=Streptomyces hydrogenans TaxID=1873719 RepID=UPI00167E41DB|nr:hypothetical protein [Streptomyces hydrogenans]